jgi:hypothetical protein
MILVVMVLPVSPRPTGAAVFAPVASRCASGITGAATINSAEHVLLTSGPSLSLD